MVITSAQRRRLLARTPWVRAAIGGILVVGSIIGVLAALSGTRDTQSVLVSNSALAPGTGLREADVSVVEVTRNAVFDGYVGPQELEG
jgi:hypothetical protein